MSPLQSGILFQCLYEPGVGVYFEQISGEVSGLFHSDAFINAWQKVCDRHAILRTSFVWRDVDVPLQLVHSKAHLPVQILDWQGKTDAQWKDDMKRFLNEDREKGFDLGQAPLMRLCIIQTEIDSWVWVWSHHHLLLDGWSVSLIFKEVLQIYDAVVLGIGAELPEPLPYSRYIAWVESQDPKIAQNHCTSLLKGYEKTSSIQLVKQDKADHQEGHEVTLKLTERETNKLQTWARQKKLTLSAVVQGAWAFLLKAYGAGDDLVYGVTVSGRSPDLAGADSMVGLFINTLPLRVKFHPGISAQEVLNTIQIQQAEMRQFEFSRLVDIQEWSDLSPGDQLFDSIFVFENYPVDESLLVQTGQLQVRNVKYFEKTNYPLTASASPGKRMTMRINFDPNHYALGWMESMIGHWRNLLMGIIEDQKFLNPISCEEQNRYLDWSGNVEDFGPSQCLHQLIEHQAQLNPNAIAVIAKSEQITYRELDQRANQCAHLLREQGIQIEDPVAIFLDRTVAVFVAMIGVLKAGGYFIPLDLRNGRFRLNQMLEDSGAIGVITNEVLVDNLPESFDGWRLMLDVKWHAIQHLPSKALEMSVCPEHLAYMIFTSGSTGRPKGVMVRHSGVYNLCQVHQHQLVINSSTRALGFASFGFDASIAEIFPTFAVGGTLCLASEDSAQSPIEFARLMNEQKVSFAILTPGFLGALDPEEFPLLTTLLIAGEAAPLSLFNKWGRGRRVFNAYGPTENSVCATLEEIGPHVNSLYLGHAISNVRVYILDPNLRQVPAGVIGEICLGGVGLARGYAGQPGLTAERFVPDPFCVSGGNCIYLTGDLGRVLSDGRTDFLGRKDHQIKVRGFRVETGEIEGGIQSHPAILNAVVLPYDSPGHGARLCAFFKKQSDMMVTPESLRMYLLDLLPDYMIPSDFYEVNEWPLNANGKIDRDSLVVPEEENQDSVSMDQSLPKNDVEQSLVRIWSDVLGADHVGLRDNFFELGGDSILSLQIIGRAYKSGLEISPKDLFTHPTIEKLAPKARAIRSKPVSEDPVSGDSALTPIQKWFFEQKLAVPNHWNQAVLLEVRDPIDIQNLQMALSKLVEHHDALRLRFRDQSQRYLDQANLDGVLKSIDCLNVADERLYEILKSESANLQASLDIENGPLMRMAFFDRGPNQTGRLLWIIHHLIVDGVSWRILLEDLGQVYQQIENGEGILLPAKTCSYARWAARLEEQAQMPKFKQQFDYWRNLHSDARIPQDFHVSSGQNKTFDVETLSLSLSVSETNSLLREVPAAYHTQINDVLLTALLTVVSHWTKEDKLYLELEGHGREDLGNDIDITRTVGWFTSIFPVILDKVSDEPSVLLPSVKEQLRCIPDNGIGYGLLRYLSEEENIRTALASVPRAQISFNYLGQSDQLESDRAAFIMAKEAIASGQSDQGNRLHLLEIIGLVTRGELKVDWVFSTRFYKRDTIESLAVKYMNSLRDLIQHCLKPDAGAYTPSDFSKVELSSRELDAIMDDLDI